MESCLIAEGQAIVRQCLRPSQPSPHQSEAAIARTENATEFDILDRSRQVLPRA